MPDRPPPKSPSEPRQRLLDAAEALFADRGFDGASVRDICERAGMNGAAVNYHFGDKERLYVETVKAAHLCADADDGAPPPSWPAGTPPVAKLRDFIALMVARMHAAPRATALRLLMRELAVPSPVTAEVVREYIQPKAFVLKGILDELFPGADPGRVLMTGFSIIGQVLFYRQNRAVAELMFGKAAVDALTADRVADHVTRFTLAALGHGEPLSSSPPPAGERGRG